jgi:hypothetical protein
VVVAHVEVVVLVVADPLWGPAALSLPVGKGAGRVQFRFVGSLLPVRKSSSFKTSRDIS